MKKIIGLPVALQQEAFSILGSKGWSKSGPFLSKVERFGDRVFWAVVTGPGAERARAGSQFLLECGASMLLNLGVAGSLVEDLDSGSLVCPSKIKGETSKDYRVDVNLGNRLFKLLVASGIKVKDGTLLTTNEVIATPKKKRALHFDTGAYLVDMEAFFISEICQNANIPFLAVKAISDSVNQVLPPVVTQCVKSNGGLNMPLLIFYLVLKPWLVSRLIEMKQGFQKAIYSLELARSVIVSHF